MKQEFVLLVNTYFNMKTNDYCVGTFENYPSDKDIESLMTGFKNENKDFIVNHARVEKRYKV